MNNITELAEDRLGLVLLDNSYANRLDDPFDWPSPLNLIKDAMVALRNNDHEINIITMIKQLSAHRQVEAVGGIAKLSSLTDRLPRYPVWPGDSQ